MSKYTLGMDIGSNSIGWALLDIGERPSIVDMGVRVFPEEGKGGSVSRGGQTVRVSQRAKRGVGIRTRRCKDRKHRRRQKLINILTKAHLLPIDMLSRIKLLNDLDTNDKESSLRPYKLRSKGLREPLELFEFGRVIMHLNQRRGYQTNRKGGDPSEDKSVAEEAKNLLREIDQSDSKTLGKYLYKVAKGEIKDTSGFVPGKIRNRRAFREMYKDEFNKLWESQEKYLKEVLKDDIEKLRREIFDAIFRQRRPKYKEPGNCDLDGQPKALRACWKARQFAIWQKINNLRTEKIFEEPEVLESEHRTKVYYLLNTKKKVSFDTLRSELGLGDEVMFNFEEGGKKKTIGGDEFLCDVRKAIGEIVWDKLKEENKEFIVDLIAKEDDDKRIHDSIKGKYIIDDNGVIDLLKVHIPEGRAAFSEDALGKLLPYIKDGKRTDEAIDLAYPPQSKRIVCETLPPIASIENHVVMKAMCELNKLVNCIVSKYGKPREIKVEMGRDLNKSRREKDKISREIKKNTERNDRVRDKIKDLEREYNLQISGIRENVVKYRLWEETGGTCVYCGTRIHPTRLFGAYQDCDVEHILPRKRSLQPKDYNNLTLCHVRCNHLKDNQTPFEAYGNNPQEYQHLLERVFKSDMPRAKKLRFIRKNLELDGSVKRFLNDARYITRQAQAHLRKLGVKVSGTKGMATALLREEAGFDTLLESMAIGRKHEDNRNHCIDAVVISITTPNLLRDLARGYEPDGRFSLAKTWTGVRKQLEERLPKINVSYRPRRRISDFFHKETAYGLTEEVRKASQAGKVEKVGERAWLCRDRLPYIATKDISEVVKTVDDIEDKLPESASNIKTTIRDRLKELGVNAKDNGTEIPWSKMVSEEEKKKAGFEGDNTIRLFLNSKHGKKIPIRKIRVKEPHSYMVLIGDKDGEPYKAYPSENNHHIEIVEYTKLNGQKERRGFIVTQIEAARRWAEKQPIVETKHYDGKFLYSLARNDMFMVQFSDGREILHRIEKMSDSSGIILRPHTYGGICKDTDKEPLVLRRSPDSLRGYKVRVDRLGNLTPAGD